MSLVALESSWGPQSFSEQRAQFRFLERRSKDFEICRIAVIHRPVRAIHKGKATVARLVRRAEHVQFEISWQRDRLELLSIQKGKDLSAR